MEKANISAFDTLVEKTLKAKPNMFVTADSNNATINKRITLDSPNLNYLFGRLGYTRQHQIYGPESSGKTSLVTAIVGNVQREMNKLYPGKDKVIYMDFERGFDPDYASKLGLDVSPGKFFLMQADTGEEGFEVIKELIKTGAVAAVVLDSDAAMPTAAELEGTEMGKATYGSQAKLLAVALRQINILCANYNTLYYQISQERPDPTIRSSYGVVKKATGGESIRFYASTRCRIKKIEEVRNSQNEATGIVVQVKNIKNKQGGGSRPWRTVELTLDFNKGFDVESEYLDMIIKLSEDLESVQRPNSRVYESSQFGFKLVGKDKFKNFLLEPENKHIFDKLKTEVDEFFTKSSSLDKGNISYSEEDDGIDIENVAQAIEERYKKENGIEDENVEGAPLSLEEDSSTEEEQTEETK